MVLCILKLVLVVVVLMVPVVCIGGSGDGQPADDTAANGSTHADAGVSGTNGASLAGGIANSAPAA